MHTWDTANARNKYRERGEQRNENLMKENQIDRWTGANES